jgi:hypothetical protein
MEQHIELPWRIYPATGVALLGLALFVRGLELGLDGIRRPFRDPQKNLTWMLGFRLGVVGLCLVAAAAAWGFEQLWLLLLALAIGGEETLESSICIFALRRGQRIGASAGFDTSTPVAG